MRPGWWVAAAVAAVTAAAAGAAGAGEAAAERIVDLGADGDEAHDLQGFYGREGPYAKARIPITKAQNFRWANNAFSLSIPVFPGQHNAVTLHAHFTGRMLLSAGAGWTKVVTGFGGQKREYAVVIPKAVVGDATRLTLSGRAVRPRRAGAGDKRTLFAILDRLVIRPVDELPPPSPKETLMAASRDIPTLDRVRGIERRPPDGDPVAFAEQLAEECANVVTLGAMNGHGHLFFPSDLGAPHPRMNPDWLPQVVPELHKRHIAALCWVCFNAQDVRNVADFVPAQRFPDWQMRFIDEPGRTYPPRVGMCVLSSPYIQHHAKVLQECAEFGIDGFFFDGFYLGGIPHPVRPACTCAFCRERFKKDTGLELPAKLDWTDRAFKRWVRWRNERLLAVARFFQAEMRKVDPEITCTFNCNMWPFGSKDWETAIPAWRVDDFGVSQHGYSGAFAQKWLMPGFKARIGRDMNPRHTDLWRACGFRHTCGRGKPDPAWHELEITTFLLAALAHGITPWHSTIEGPIELTARIHAEVAKRERYFSRDHVANVAVLYSQNTHDFYGHIPGTSHLSDYRDGILGTWMILSENHVPFEFVFDNQLEEGMPEGYDVLVLPNAAALSERAAGHIAAWVQGRAGRLVLTADAGAFDEWGDKLAAPRFDGLLRMARGEAPIPKRFGTVVHLAQDPGQAYCRRRDGEAAGRLLRAVRSVELPFEVNAPASLVVNLFRSPDGKERWVHLLNVSPFMPGGDTGFRGMGRPAVKVGDVASDADLERRGGRAIGGPLVPAEGVVFKLNGARPRAARLAVAGHDLTINKRNEIALPPIGLHDVLVLTVE